MDPRTLTPNSMADGIGATTAPPRTWKHRIAHEMRRYLGLFLYLWVMFGLFLLHESVVLARYNIPFTRWGFALVTAFILAKVMLVMEDLNRPRGFDGRPLIYSIVYKAVVFAGVFIIFYVAEETVGGMIKGKTILESIPSLGGGTPQGILATIVIVSLALVPYFAFRELGRALGEGELHALLFTRPRAAVPRPASSEASSWPDGGEGR